MGQVDISINSKGYRIACEDGEEDRIKNLASMVEGHVKDLVEQVGQIGDNRLLVMASLLIADEFMDLRDVRDPEDDVNGDDLDEEKIASAMESLSERIENIAESLEAT